MQPALCGELQLHCCSNPRKPGTKVLLLSPFYSWRNRVLDKFKDLLVVIKLMSHLSKVTWSVKGLSRDPNQICLTLQSELLTKWNCQSLKLLIFKTNVFSLVFFYVYDLICVKSGPELINCFALYSFKLYIFQTHDLWCLHDILTYESSTNLTILNFSWWEKNVVISYS